MNVLVLGSGGREHAISWKLSQSKILSKLYIAPGNPGTQLLGINVPINPSDFEELKMFVIKEGIDLVFVGPEDFLVKGIYDYFKLQPELNKVKVIGPSKRGAQLEGSKRFAKEFMTKYGIPTASFKSFVQSQRKETLDFLTNLQPPYVIKADGLAAGKGVAICGTLPEATAVVDDFFSGKFGEASKTIVIEEFLEGIELSVFVLTDGQSYVILPEAKDYKRIGDNDTGPNTGGMGAISPVPFADSEFIRKVEEEVIKPTIYGIRNEEIEYVGFIFIGLMNVKGNPFVIEYNVRLGDPETQVVMPRISGDFLSLLIETANGNLSKCQIEHTSNWASTVILASEGYPNNYRKGDKIEIEGTVINTILFHAGTSINENAELISSGGRVMACTGIADSITNSIANAYKLVNTVNFNGKYFRRDIGQDLLHLKEKNKPCS